MTAVASPAPHGPRQPGAAASPPPREARWLDLSPAAYHADPCPTPSLSQSCAHTLLARSAHHAWLQHPRLGGAQGEAPREPTAAMILGTVVHALVLGRGATVEAIPFDDFRTTAARAARDAARAAGRVPITHAVALQAAALAATIQGRLAEQGIVLDGESERVALWTEDTAHGPVLCRGQMDHVREERGEIFDLKIVRSAHPRSIARHLVSFGADIQAAAYTRALERIRPELAGRTRFTFLCCEVETGAVVPATLAGDLRRLGELRWQRAVETWARCLATNVWPGYATGPIVVEAPQWALAEELNESLEEEGA